MATGCCCIIQSAFVIADKKFLPWTFRPPPYSRILALMMFGTFSFVITVPQCLFSISTNIWYLSMPYPGIVRATRYRTQRLCRISQFTSPEKSRTSFRSCGHQIMDEANSVHAIVFIGYSAQQV